MHCAITSANNFSGQSVVISRISLVQLAGSVRKSPEQPVCFSYTSALRVRIFYTWPFRQKVVLALIIETVELLSIWHVICLYNW